MSHDLMLDVGQANELKLAFRRVGFSNEDVKSLCEERDILRGVRDVLRGLAVITSVEHVIDLDADPFVPDGWKVEEHKQGGQLTFDPSQVEFCLDDGQKNGKYIVGHELRKELADKRVMNANELDFLLANPDLIPEGWKIDEDGSTRYIFFWGTVYRHSDGFLYVRCLYWDGGRWRWGNSWLGGGWRGRSPAALRVS